MKAVERAAVFMFIVLAIAVVVLLVLVYQKRNNPTKASYEINRLRIEIVKLDSIRRSEQRRQMDSMMQQIKVTQAQAEKLNSINQKLRQQNEKLDRIYNSVHADMPDF